MAYATYPLLSNASATGSAVEWPGGAGVFHASGTFSGATIKLQWSPNNSTWFDVDRSGDTYVTFTAAGLGAFELPAGYVRAVVTGGPPSAMYADVRGLA